MHLGSSSAFTTNLIPGPPLSLPDSIFWNEKDASVYYADFITAANTPSIYRYDTLSQQLYGAYIAGCTNVSYFVPVQSCSVCNVSRNLFGIGNGHDNFIIQWDGITPTAQIIHNLFRTEVDVPLSIMDLGAQNHDGQLFAGTTHANYCKGTSNSSLYTISKKRGVEKIYTGFTATSGLAFVKDKIYHIDVCQQTLTVLQKNSFGICKLFPYMYLLSAMKILYFSPMYLSDSRYTVFDFKTIGMY